MRLYAVRNANSELRGLIAPTAVMAAVAAIDADMRRITKCFGGLPPAHDDPKRRPTHRACLCRGTRRSVAPPAIARFVDLGLVPKRYQSGRSTTSAAANKRSIRRFVVCVVLPEPSLFAVCVVLEVHGESGCTTTVG